MNKKYRVITKAKGILPVYDTDSYQVAKEIFDANKETLKIIGKSKDYIILYNLENGSKRIEEYTKQ
jgi:DNA-binding HxlR family transcriptional regulator